MNRIIGVILAVSLACSFTILSLLKAPVLPEPTRVTDSPLKKYVDAVLSPYTAKCFGHDSIRPITGECDDSFGFPVLMMESMELLFILGMDETLRPIEEYITEEFSCKSLDWVDYRVFVKKGLASLIGMSVLSNNRVYDRKASECVEMLPKTPVQFFNFRTKKSITKNTTIMVSPQEITSFHDKSYHNEMSMRSRWEDEFNRTEFGYAPLSVTKHGKKFLNDYNDGSFLGYWIKSLAMEEIPVANECGHILLCPRC